VPERERLIARIRQIRRTAAPIEQPDRAVTAAPPQEQLHALETRIGHLEQLVQGLQDALHRDSSRHSKRLGDLEARTQPAALGKALSEDARARGL
jgi:hypothetical protein